MELKLERHFKNPLFGPNPNHIWESRFVFNPAVVFDGELFHMLYRAQGEDMVSRLGYAVSTDGIHWNRLEKYVFGPSTQEELYGVEDPRITFLEGYYYINYTAYSPTGIKVAMARTKNFITYERFGTILPESPNKDATLFPEKINGKYVLIHRIEPDIYLAFSDDLIHWENYVKIASPRKNYWDNLKIGAGAPPIKTKYGWLLLYHGVQKAPRNIYRLGFMLLDLNDPTKIIKRSQEPILEPKEEWEIFGGVPNVVFSDAMVRYKDKYYIYYGGADNYIALATIDTEKVEKWIKE
ncbi:glycosidase [Thermosipho sp. 1063]|uniref:glycoside hydrolase family 130 protein n=1 Tax=unclassified Thermosipho (in: thermotogales) TaxID=2676525 RepID=UPI0009493CBB|nr:MULTISPECIES: glycosidase [unclassified Thermosipho (in: thermotogales)]ANQ53725.1 glycosidase [Thermosipho sp. 1070]APT72171.1 glycosidase [Thermosipho sp. 1063]OOC43412.1 glycosidase [Thermosipho sp. 1074]